jgi:geranylgeranyl diphosphate synthase type II
MSKDFKSRLEAVIRKFGDDAGTVKDAAAHHLSRGGKRTRANLIFAAAKNFEHPDALIHIAAAAELIHEASLVHDDIQDRTPVRRSQPTVWKKYGSNTALLLGDHLIAAAFRSLAASSCRHEALSGLVQVMAAAVSRASSGQLQQLKLDINADALLSQYQTIAQHKTGSLLALPLQFAAVLADGDGRIINAARRCGEHLGLAYQILNDLVPLNSGAYAQHEDIVDRVVTAPVVAASRLSNSRKDLFTELVNQPRLREFAYQTCSGWVRDAADSARSNAAWLPAPVETVVYQFIADYLTLPSVSESVPRLLHRAPRTPLLATANS